MRQVFFRVISFFRSSRADAEVAREIEAHLRLLEDDYRARGMDADEARFAARRAFGGQLEQTRWRHRDARTFRALDEWWLDARLGARMLVKYPGLTVVGGLGIAVAVAISTASFAFFYAYLASTLPVPEGERVVALENWNVEANNEERQALHDYLEWRDTLGTMEEVGAFRTISRNLIVPGGAVEPVRIAEISASAFRIARVPPLLGRPLLDEDERAGAPAVVVIGHDVWTTRFASDPAVIGRQLRFGNAVHTIVGVMPQGHEFPVNHSYWVPWPHHPARYARGRGPELFIIGRLADGVTLAEAQAELTAVGAQNAARFPDTHARLRPQVLNYAYPILDIQDVSLWQVGIMQATVSVLLLVVAVNVAILIYARTATRQGEIAVRSALGASRSRIVAQFFVEALVLAALASAVGLGIAKVGLDQAHAIMQSEGSARPPYWIDHGLPWAAVAYVIALAAFAAVIAGVLPALHATGRRVQTTLRQLTGSTGLRLGGTWSTLIVAQVSLAVVVLPMAGASARQEVRFTTTRPVFAVERYLAARLALEQDEHETATAIQRSAQTVAFADIQQRLVTRLEAEPWVADVTVAARPPGQESSALVEIEGHAAPSGAVAQPTDVNQVDVDFFAAFDARLLAGRSFARADSVTNAAPPPHPAATAVVVNRGFADTLLGGASPIGRRVRYAASPDGERAASPWYDIVGLVENLHANRVSPEVTSPVMYHPLPAAATSGSVTIRVAGGTPADYAGRLRELLAAIDPTVRMVVAPLADLYRQADTARRLVGGAVALVVVTVLLLSAAGIYAMMSFAVSQRRKEIGIRAALGADRARLLRSLFARAAGQLGMGVVIGLATALLMDVLSGGQMLGSASAVLLGTMTALMLATGLLASIGPARRGLRIEPTQALRDE